MEKEKRWRREKKMKERVEEGGGSRRMAKRWMRMGNRVRI